MLAVSLSERSSVLNNYDNKRRGLHSAAAGRWFILSTPIMQIYRGMNRSLVKSRRHAILTLSLAVILAVSALVSVAFHGVDGSSKRAAVSSNGSHPVTGGLGHGDHSHEVERHDTQDHVHEHNPTDHSHEVPGLVAVVDTQFSHLRPHHGQPEAVGVLETPSQRLDRPPMPLSFA